jgi:threonine/homoserine/homoserine lactone efflux protein
LPLSDRPFSPLDRGPNPWLHGDAIGLDIVVTFETWLAFTAASAVLLVIPGPTILLVVSYALGQGWRTALPMAIGVALGDFTAMTLSLLGLGALLAASATLFTILKWAGAAYLVWLGIKLWRAGGALDARPRTDAASALKMLGHAWLVTALNPKGLTFFIAFLPQFIDPKLALLPQVSVFAATFLTLAFANVITYTLIASRARRVVQSPRTMRVINRTGGSLLIGTGVATVALRAGQA